MLAAEGWTGEVLCYDDRFDHLNYNLAMPLASLDGGCNARTWREQKQPELNGNCLQNGNPVDEKFLGNK